MIEQIIPIQNTAPLQNNVDWYIIALAIIAGSALISFGIGRNFERWEAEMEWPEWVSILGEILGIIVATGAGALSGYLTWDWKLGLLCGTVGGWGAPFIVTWLHKYISKKTGSPSKASTDPKSKNFGNITLLPGYTKKSDVPKIKESDYAD